MSRFLVGAKTQKLLVNFFWNFNMTFLATWWCASDFLKMPPKFKMAVRGQLQKILWAQKLNVRNYSNSTMTPPYGDVQVTFSRFYWNSKWPPRINFNFFCGHENQPKARIYSNFTIKFPTIWICASDFLKFYWNSKWPPWMNLIFFVGAKTPKLKSEIIHILQSHHPPSGHVLVILLKIKIATTSRLFIYLWWQKL